MLKWPLIFNIYQFKSQQVILSKVFVTFQWLTVLYHEIITRKSFQWFFNDFKDPIILHGFLSTDIHWFTVIFSHAIIIQKLFRWFFNDFKDLLILHWFFIHWHPFIFYILSCSKCCFSDISMILLKIYSW